VCVCVCASELQSVETAIALYLNVIKRDRNQSSNKSDHPNHPTRDNMNQRGHLLSFTKQIQLS
jgi:hypothetical protein